ncbi:MAG: restriction endonuclease subunit S [Oscillospiraceae bacterium]|nr:restriction endonuclease subunit S [Oscillospiraceae bacterium]
MRYVELKDVCKINMGQSPDSKSYNENGNGIPFFQGNADFGDRYPVTRVWCNSPTKIAESGDILISVRAPIGALNYADKKCCIGRGLAALTPDKTKVSSEFIFWLLKGKNAELNNQGTGSTFKAISKKVLEETKVPNIPLEKQYEISNRLEKIYSIIQFRQIQLTKLDELIKARFVEMFGDPSSNPMGWEETSIGKECYYIKDGPHKSLPDIGKENGGHPFISVRNIVNGYIDFSDARYISDENFNEAIKKCHPEKGDMLYSKGGTTGIAKLIDIDDEFANWVHVAVLKFDKTKLNGIFFENMLNGDYCYKQSQRLTKGIANRDLVLSAMAQIKIFLPPIDLQNQFADFVQQVDKSKVVIQKHLEKAQLLFDSLMQEYFG